MPIHKMNGVLNINKPFGITSMDVVRKIKVASNQRRVGHGGTLDPAATGVIPVFLGHATRLIEYLVDSQKSYQAIIELGTNTDTYDSQGTVLKTKPFSHISCDTFLATLAAFQGTIMQVPPMFSAVKKNGRRLYELARSGIKVDLQPRQVTVYAIELVNWSPPTATITITCGKGFYVRSLAFDIGNRLGCGAHLNALVRTKNGPFEISRALTLETALDRLVKSDWDNSLYNPDIVVREYHAMILGDNLARMMCHGRSLPELSRIAGTNGIDVCRAYSTDGRFLGILRRNTESGLWNPEKVFLSHTSIP